MLEDFTARTFSEHLGETFVAGRDASETVDMELVSVEESGGESATGGRPFSVVFREPGGFSLSQGTHRMEHEVIGVFEIFLVPVGVSPDGAGLLYEAVFN